ncbi:DNA-binding protein [Flavobacteriaceae bacterium 144Ye]|nr:DNA-binding protein [Flavobacteriaceae bacterium 144Ye]
MEKTKILHLYEIDVNSFAEKISATVSATVSENLLNVLEEQFSTKNENEKGYYSRKELSKILGVTIQTLIEWDKRGILKPLRIGNLIRYNKQDIDNALNYKFNGLR